MHRSRALLAWIFLIRHRVRAATQGLICPLGQAGGGLHKGKGPVTPLPPLSGCTVIGFCPPPPRAGVGLFPAPAHTDVRSSTQRFQRGLTGHPSTCLESPWQAQQLWVQEVQLGPGSSSPCRTLGIPEFLARHETAPGAGKGRASTWGDSQTPQGSLPGQSLMVFWTPQGGCARAKV